jgi:hypothetical protein
MTVTLSEELQSPLDEVLVELEHPAGPVLTRGAVAMDALFPDDDGSRALVSRLVIRSQPTSQKASSMMTKVSLTRGLNSGA